MGLPAIKGVSVPPFGFDCVVNRLLPMKLLTPAFANVRVKVSRLAHVWLTVMKPPAIDAMLGLQVVPPAFATDTNPGLPEFVFCGVVHPNPTCRPTCDPAA